MLKNIGSWFRLAVLGLALTVLFAATVKISYNLDKNIKNMRLSSVDRDLKFKDTLSVFDELKALKDEAAKLRQTVASLQEENKSLSRQKKNISRSLNKLQQKYDQLKQNNSELVLEKESRLKTEKEMLEASTKEYRDKISESSKKYADLENKFNSLKKEYDSLAGGYKDILGESSGFKKDNASLQKNRDVLTAKLAALQNDFQDRKAESRDLSLQIKRLTQENVTLGEEKKYYESQQAKSLSVLESQMKRWQNTERKYTELLRENKILKDKSGSAPGKIAELTRFNKQILKEKALLHYNLGVLYTRKGDYQRAVKEFNEVLKINSTDADAHYNLGIIYSEYIFDKDKAELHFRKYLDVSPNDKDADRARKYILVQEASGKKK